MLPQEPGNAGQSTSRVRGLVTETLLGVVLGAAGGLLFGLLFGLLSWSASGAAQVVLASGWAGLWAAALAGGVASFANMWFGWEQIGWQDLVTARRVTRERPSDAVPLTAAVWEGDLIIRITREAIRVSAAPPKWASNGQASVGPPRKAP